MYSLSALSVGSVATYRCDTGFVLVGSSVVTCQNDGTWTDAPLCRAANTPCSEPPQVSNGYALFDSVSIGAIATYECQDGYMLEGPKSVTCAAGGLWTPLPHCVEIRCPSPHRLLNGRVSFPSLSVGSVSTFKCDEGFNLKGPEQIQCSTKGKWLTLDGLEIDESAVECQGTLCQPPPQIPNAEVDVTSVAVGAVAVYYCRDGFEVKGDSPLKVECLQDGTWSQTDARCQAKSCGPPPPLPNSSMGYSQTTVGSTTFYICLPGFNMVGSSFSTCLPNGTWSRGPKCERYIETTHRIVTEAQAKSTTTYALPEIRLCPDPPKIPNGVVSFHSLQPGSLAVYQCLLGYELVGSKIVDCLPDGDWSEPPFCRLVRTTEKKEPKVQLEKIMVTRQLKKAKPQITSTPAYNDDYDYYGLSFDNAEIVDIKKPSPVKLIGCGDPPMVKRATAHYSDTSMGSVTIYTCDQGMVMYGNPIIRCLETGSWEATLPKCQGSPKLCDPPPEIQDGEVFYSLTTVGSLAVYKCFEGKILSGGQVIKCQSDATWEKPPTCVSNIGCDKPPQIANSEVEFNSTTPGSLAVYRCHFGYKMKGTKKSFCMQDSLLWTAPPQCLEVKCLNPPSITNGNVKFDETLTIGSNATYTCDEGFTLDGSPTIECNEYGRWADPPQCLPPPPCGNPPKIMFGEVSYDSDTVGSLATYKCFPGYGRNGPETIKCRSVGQWGSPPECILLPTIGKLVVMSDVNCGPAPEVAHSSMRSSGATTIGSEVNYTCDEDYRLEGNKTVVCGQDGKWSALPHCVESIGGFSCGQPPIIEHAVVSYSGIGYGSRALYTCDDGYSLTGNDEIVCGKDGHWSRIPSCRRNNFLLT